MADHQKYCPLGKTCVSCSLKEAQPRTCIAADFVEDCLEWVPVLLLKRLARIHDRNLDACRLSSVMQLCAEVPRCLHGAPPILCNMMGRLHVRQQRLLEGGGLMGGEGDALCFVMAKPTLSIVAHS